MVCTHPIEIKNLQTGSYILVPCGKCYNCQSNKRSNWTFRLLEENKYSALSKFVTLTYDEEHYQDIPNKRDIQLFLKRYRKSLDLIGVHLRYFIVSERGKSTNRVHYHALFFYNQYMPELEEETLKNGMIQNRLISDAWSLGGTVTLQCDNGSIHYVTKYNLKFLGFEEDCFVLMSRNPGIGYNFCETNENNSNRTVFFPGGQKISMPRYYRKKLGYNYGSANLDIQQKLYKDADEFVKKYPGKTQADFFKLMLESEANKCRRLTEKYKHKLI